MPRVSNGTTERQASAEGAKVGMNTEFASSLSLVCMPATKEILMIRSSDREILKNIKNKAKTNTDHPNFT